MAVEHIPPERRHCLLSTSTSNAATRPPSVVGRQHGVGEIDSTPRQLILLHVQTFDLHG